MRFLDKAYDPTMIEAYPLQTFQCKIRRRKCNICAIYAAAFITYGDDLAPASPAFFCRDCFQTAHYSADGNLLPRFADSRHFRVFDYTLEEF